VKNKNNRANDYTDRHYAPMKDASTSDTFISPADIFSFDGLRMEENEEILVLLSIFHIIKIQLGLCV